MDVRGSPFCLEKFLAHQEENKIKSAQDDYHPIEYVVLVAKVPFAPQPNQLYKHFDSENQEEKLIGNLDRKLVIFIYWIPVAC